MKNKLINKYFLKNNMYRIHWLIEGHVIHHQQVTRYREKKNVILI